MFKLKFISYGAVRVSGIQAGNLNLNSLNTFNSSTIFFMTKLNFSSKARLDPYLILEVNRQADWKTIKQAYFRLARLYHPDMNKNDEVSKILIKIYINIHILYL